MSYLIDTDWVIDHLRQVEVVTRRLEELTPEGLALSIVSLAELYEGVYYSRDPVRSEEVLKNFLSPELEILDIDQETCQIFGRERGRLRQQGRSIGDMDLFIAATCLRHNLSLLSNNRRHFEQVEGLEIISINP
jgi:tRNA(fMet)-specific endonuclease VapC